MKRKNPTKLYERDVQIAVIDYCEKIEYLKDIFSINNERRCTVGEGKYWNKLGRKEGVSDLFLPLPNSNHHGMFMELKVGRNKLTNKQKEFLDKMANRGYATCVPYCFEEAQEYLLTYIDNIK